MKTIYRAITGNFSSPREDFFETREEAYNSIDWEYNYGPYNPVTIEKLVLDDDNKIEVYECFSDSDWIGAYDNWSEEEHMFIFWDSEDDKYTAKEYFRDWSDNYELGSWEPSDTYEEWDHKYKDLFLKFTHFNMGN